MARIRYIKPDLFLDEELGKLSIAARLCFVGLWTLADRMGRLEDRPERIRAQLFPYDGDFKTEPLLKELAEGNFIIRYRVDKASCIEIRSFKKHQRPHPREADSNLPAPDGECPTPDWVEDALETASREITRPAVEEADLAAEGTDPAVKFPPGNGEWGMGMGRGTESESAAPPARDPSAAGGATAQPWRSGYEWCERFKGPWGAKYSGRFYGNSGDGKAQRELEDQVLSRMPEEELKALWERVDEFFARYLASEDHHLVQARHPFGLFGVRFVDFRPDIAAPPEARAPPRRGRDVRVGWAGPSQTFGKGEQKL